MGLRMEGFAPVFTDENGNLVVDTDELGYDDDIELEGDWDDEYDDDDVDLEGEYEDLDLIGARGRRRRRKGRGGRGRPRRQRRPRSPRRPSGGSGSYTQPATVSATEQSDATLGAGASETFTMTLTPSVPFKAQTLRASIVEGAGGVIQYLITQIRIGDDLVWNDSNGFDAGLLSGETTLHELIKGKVFNPAQPMYISGTAFNRDGANPFTSSAYLTVSVVGKKRPNADC